MFRSFGRLKGWAGQGGASCHSLELNGGTAAALVVVHQHRALLLHCCDAASAGGRAGRGASVRCAGAAWQRCCAGPTHAVPLGPFARLTASCRQASMRDSSDAAARTAETTGDAVLVRAGGYSDLAAAEHPALGVAPRQRQLLPWRFCSRAPLSVPSARPALPASPPTLAPRAPKPLQSHARASAPSEGSGLSDGRAAHLRPWLSRAEALPPTLSQAKPLRAQGWPTKDESAKGLAPAHHRGAPALSLSLSLS